MYSRQAVEKGAQFVFGKEEGPVELGAAVEKALRACGYRDDVEIDWPSELNSIRVARHIFPENPSQFEEEAKDVLRRLFKSATTLRPALLDPQNNTPSLTLRPRSLVVQVKQDDHTLSHFVKIGRRRRAEQEVDNFQKVYPYFGSNPYGAPTSEPTALWNLGGAVYNFAGDYGRLNPMLFSKYYGQHKVGDIQAALDTLEEFWRQLYRQRAGERRLFGEYCRVWGTEWLYTLVSHARSGLSTGFPEALTSLSLPNPVEWLVGRVRLNERGIYVDSKTPFTEVARTHGDLHGDNFFVTAHHDVWVIDFERTGYGPILQDWIELEHDILTRLMPLQADEWRQFGRLICTIAGPCEVREWARVEGGLLDRIGHSETDKALEVIDRIRDLAKRCSDSSRVDAQQYIWGLLLNAIFRLIIWWEDYQESSVASENYEEAQERKQKLLFGIQRCLVLAGILCHRLDIWDENPDREWPPTAWRAVLSDLEIPPVLTPGQSPDWQQIPFRLQATKRARNKRKFDIYAVDTPRGEPTEQGMLPFDEVGLVAVLKALELGYLGKFTLGSFSEEQLTVLRRLNLLEGTTLASDHLKLVGQLLHKTLLPGEVMNAFVVASEGARQQRDATITMQLRFADSDTVLARYPWELLHDGRQYLLPSGRVELTRYIAYPEGSVEAQTITPYRVLYIEARPKGISQLPKNVEREAVKQALEPWIDAGKLEFYSLSLPTYRSFQDHQDLLARIDIIHFDGHGIFGRRCDECKQIAYSHIEICPCCGASLRRVPPSGFLVFEDTDGDADPIEAERLRNDLSRSRVRLAYLSACQSATVRGDSVFGGVGPGLVQAGVPSVVAMQFPARADHARDFAQAFYSSIARYDTLTDGVISNAVFQGRRRAFPDGGWFLPALYLRSKSHQD